ncbi:hypothetical protein FH063_000664 [Azospirillum argentinense]|uniref:Uncharacterized protein n=1 Tax=Azospirillum argentinense TaxID=2970906 RepID=A0A5B0L584_9PROT|nr:hypothetical protein FH063_000664 [Azospirillum argentinense]
MRGHGILSASGGGAWPYQPSNPIFRIVNKAFQAWSGAVTEAQPQTAARFLIGASPEISVNRGANARTTPAIPVRTTLPRPACRCRSARFRRMRPP